MSRNHGVIIKTEEELEIMREAGRINAQALDAARALIRPGITTAELDDAAEEVIRSYGAVPAFKGYPGPYPYPATLTVSINEELVHGIPGNRVLVEGDIVSVDCGTIYKGYVGDSAFTAGVGEISPEAKKLLEVTEKSLYLGIEQAKKGNHVGDISAAIQDYVESFGFHGCCVHGYTFLQFENRKCRKKCNRRYCLYSRRFQGICSHFGYTFM